MPADSARCASSTAYSPGSEINARLAPSSSRAAAHSDRGGTLPAAVGAGAARVGRERPLGRVQCAVGRAGASTAITMSPGRASAGTGSSSRLAGVPARISHARTPSWERTVCATCINRTLST